MSARRRLRDEHASILARVVMWVVVAATLMLVVVGARAVWLSQDATRRLLERRQKEQLALLVTGLDQDMRGAQVSVLDSIPAWQLSTDPPYDLADTFARGFARFPYPESFFSWRASADGDRVYLFNRSNRRPSWQTPAAPGPYPVDVVRDPAELAPALAALRQRAAEGRSLVASNLTIEGSAYQIVARPLFDGDDPSRWADRRLVGLVGFTVNLDWVRRHYFRELTAQISRIGGGPEEVTLAIVDSDGGVIDDGRAARSDIPALSRPFALLFADTRMLRTLGRRDFQTWSAQASAAGGNSMATSATGASWIFALLSIATVVGVAGLLMTGHSIRAASQLAATKSEFVAGVTHELKTPLSVIQLVADTLVRGRYESAQAIHSYAKLLAKESQHLQRLVENLLAYASLSDPDHALRLSTVNIQELIDVVLERFDLLLAERQFQVEVHVADDLRTVSGDRSALLQALDNVIDNAIKYSESATWLQVAARNEGTQVVITVADRGVGIERDEVDRVCDRFFRGRDATSRGSGLGLAIVRRVLDAHGGTLVIHSARHEGTAVDLRLPADVVHG